MEARDEPQDQDQDVLARPPAVAEAGRRSGTRPLAGILSRQAAHPHGPFGRALGRLWVTETAAVNDAALDLLGAVAGEQVLELGFGPGRSLGVLAERVRATGDEQGDNRLSGLQQGF